MTRLLAAARGAMIALGLSVLGALTAAAQTAIEVTEDSVAAILKGEGLKAEIGYDEDSYAPYIASYWDKVKANFDVRFEACDEDGFFCEVMIFTAGFYFEDKSATAASHQKINDWNLNHWGKAFVDDEGTMWISLESSTIGGQTKENILDTLHWFESLMSDYTTFIGWQPN